MYNKRNYRRVGKGSTYWNDWRDAHPDVSPDLSRATLSGENLEWFDFNHVDFEAAFLEKTNLANAFLTGADFAGEASSQAILTDANLSHARLDQADFSGVSLAGANLENAYAMRTNFSGADLSNATLRGSVLGGTIFGIGVYFVDMVSRPTILKHADFSGAKIIGAVFNSSILEGADFSNVQLGWASFSNVDFSKVKGLSKVEHLGPSSVDLESLSRSVDKMPKEFLRGIGIQDADFEIISNLSTVPSMYRSCFISYSSKDIDFVLKLNRSLTKRKIPFWLAEKDLRTGDKLRESFHKTIRSRDAFLIILSENSISSPWVEAEFEEAIETEKNRDELMLMPVTIDNAVFDSKIPWVSHIRQTRVILNFRDWKNKSSYNNAFDKLVLDLEI